MRKELSGLRGACVVLCLLLASCATVPGNAPARASADAALAAHRAWWTAYTAGDVGHVEAHSADGAAATFSSGTRMTRTELLAQAAGNSAASGLALAWSDEQVAFRRDGLALVTATLDERVGNSAQAFRVLALIDGVDGPDWRVAAIQTTRVARHAPAVDLAASGPLSDFAGRYATPKGLHLRMEPRDEVLWMVEPSGKAIALRAIGPGIFESEGQSPVNGILRFVFSRDPAGRVSAFNRLTEGRVDSFPRVP